VQGESSIGREDDLDDEDYQVREVYAQFGLTVYKAQVLEKGIVNVTTFGEAVAMGERDPDRFAVLYDSLWDANFQLTLGPLLKKFRRVVDDDHKLAAELSAALKTRNRLAHTFFWEHAEDMMSFAGREAMLSELLLNLGQFHALDERVDGIMHDRLVTIAGWTPQQISREIQTKMHEGRERAARH
jgi:hypothetical protein